MGTKRYISPVTVPSAKAAMAVQMWPQSRQPAPARDRTVVAGPALPLFIRPRAKTMAQTPMIHSSIGSANALLIIESALAALAAAPFFFFFFFFGLGTSSITGAASIGSAMMGSSRSGMGGAIRSSIGGGGS